MSIIKNLLLIVCALLLAACSGKGDVQTKEELAHELMHKHHFNGTAEVPDALSQKAATSPTFPIGSEAVSKAKHMGGMMEDVKVTIVAAYDTTAYETSFTLPDGRHQDGKASLDCS